MDARTNASPENEFLTVRQVAPPPGLLLSKVGLLVMLAGLLLAAWYGQVIIVIVLGLLLAAAGISKLWSRLSLQGVTYQRVLETTRAFPGESIGLKLQLANRKLLPLPWIQVEDEIPAAFLPGKELEPGNRPGSVVLGKGTALLWYTKVSWQESLRCEQRGYYRLGPLTAISGDIFGFYPRVESAPAEEYIVVYPRLYPIARLGIPSRYFMGDTTAEQRIFEDPTRLIGVRDYTPQDSLRHVHWKATARHGNLQIKVFEPTTTVKAALFLAVDSFTGADGARREDDLELAISTAASVASYLTAQGSQAGLFVNTRLADTGQPARIPPGSGASQLTGVLEALAKTTYGAAQPFAAFLQDELRNLAWGTTLIPVVGALSEPLAAQMGAYRERGHRIMGLQIGGPPPSRHDPGIGWHIIHNPDDITAPAAAEAA